MWLRAWNSNISMNSNLYEKWVENKNHRTRLDEQTRGNEKSHASVHSICIFLCLASPLHDYAIYLLYFLITNISVRNGCKCCRGIVTNAHRGPYSVVT